MTEIADAARRLKYAASHFEKGVGTPTEVDRAIEAWNLIRRAQSYVIPKGGEGQCSKPFLRPPGR